MKITTALLLKAIGWFEIGGGLFGVLLIARAVAGGPRSVSLGLVAMAGIFFGTSLWAGWTLLRRGETGLIPSMVLQMVQVPRLSLYGFSYSLASGAHLTIQLRGGELQFTGQLGSHVTLGTAAPDLPWIVGINYLALSALLLLLRSERATVSGPSSERSSAVG